MIKKSLFSTLLICMMQVVMANAPDTLTLNNAIALALDKNFSISLAENTLRMAELANTIGNAGMLPKLSLSAGRTLAVNNSKQVYFDGRLREGKNASTNSKNAGLQLNWTIFDGFNMFIQKDKLSLLESMGSDQLRSVIENTVAMVINTYYTISTQHALALVYKNSLSNSAERLSFAKSKYQLGSNSELAVLQATVDLNADSAMYLRQISLVENLKADLNLLLCREITEKFEVENQIPVNYNLQLDDLISRAFNENPDLQRARKDVMLASQGLKESKSLHYPKLNFNSGYSYSQSNSEVGIMTLNRNYGYNLGLSLTYNIFDGFSTKRQIAQARIREESVKTSAEKLELELKTNLIQVYTDYQTNINLAKFESGNLELAKRNYRIAEEKYRLGSLTDIELREIQVKTLEAENRLLNSLFRCKSAETELYRLAGILSVEQK